MLVALLGAGLAGRAARSAAVSSALLGVDPRSRSVGALAGARGGRRPGAPPPASAHRSRLLQGALRARPRHRRAPARALVLRRRPRADAARRRGARSAAPPGGLRGLRRAGGAPSRRSSSQGRAVPPAFEAESPLVATLRERRKPLALSAAGRTPDAAELGPFDRAALEALQAEVVVPVRRDEALLAFLCLGPKRSGDVYTSTDLSHLAAVAEAVSSQLRRFDQEEVIAARRARCRSRCAATCPAPSPSSSRAAPSSALGRARGLGAVRRPPRLHELLRVAPRRGDLLDREPLHRRRCREIVREHGGSVVEFNGDGMMAVFGAPRELPHKERAAVAAGREIVDRRRGAAGRGRARRRRASSRSASGSPRARPSSAASAPPTG